MAQTTQDRARTGPASPNLDDDGNLVLAPGIDTDDGREIRVQAIIASEQAQPASPQAQRRAERDAASYVREANRIAATN